MGIEPMRSENSSFLDCRLNHSAKVSVTTKISPATRQNATPAPPLQMKILSLNLHFFSDPRII